MISILDNHREGYFVVNKNFLWDTGARDKIPEKSRNYGKTKIAGNFCRTVIFPEFLPAVVTKRLPVRSARRGGSYSGLAPMRAAWPLRGPKPKKFGPVVSGAVISNRK